MNTRFRTSSPRGRTRVPALALLFLASLTAGGPASQARGEPAGPCPEYWWVSTRACPQVLGSDPWPFLEASQLDGQGCLNRCDPGELLARAANRPVFVVVHGSNFTADQANSDMLRIRDDLAAQGALPPDAIFVTFDWPSQRVYPNPFRDGNEKGRRAFVAGYHLARFLQMFPPGARVGMLGHSHGGLALLSALQLLGGGVLDDGEQACRLSDASSPAVLMGPRIRAVVIASASDRQWLVPGERFEHALPACEALLCLYNCLDPVLVVHPFGRYTDHRAALGRRGLSTRDEERLGPLGCRYREENIACLLGARHTFKGTVAIPEIARWIAPYAWSPGQG